MHGSKKAGVVKTCKKWRMTRAQRFECYCREFKTDTGVNVGRQCKCRSSGVVDLIGNEEF